MSTKINDTGFDNQHLLLSSLPVVNNIDIDITLGTTKANMFDDSGRSFLIDRVDNAINSSVGIHGIYNSGAVSITAGVTVQIDSGTVYANGSNPTIATFNTELASGSVIKIRNFDRTTNRNVSLFGTPDNATNFAMYGDIAQIDVYDSSDSSLIATFDLTTPAAQYTNNSVVLDYVNYQAPDLTPPTFTAGPVAGNASAVGHTITGTIDKTGVIYAVRLASGAAAPTSAQVRDGQDSTGSPALESKNAVANANASTSLPAFVTGSPSTTYDYYVVAEDDAGVPNLQASPEPVISATTTSGSANIDGGVLTFGAAFTGTYTGMASIASPITIGPDSQGNTLNVTVVDGNDGTFSGTMPSLPASGTASLILVESNLTLTATEV